MASVEQLARRFGHAAQNYDQHAIWHRQCADYLVRLIDPTRFQQGATILELGSGTGYLSRRLANDLTNSNQYHWLITDLSEMMVEQAKEKWDCQVSARFFCMDAENPSLLPNSVDIIISNLVFQWLNAHSETLARLQKILKPGGQMVWSALLDDSFASWKAHCKTYDYPNGIHPLFPQKLLSEWGLIEQKIDHIRFSKGYHFMRWLKGIGAQNAHPAYQSLSYTALVQLLRSWDQRDEANKTIELQVAYGVIHV